jgi:predicted ArsR family transcriptional regulator
MINQIEFKLKSTEFKILQYLKTNNNVSQEDIAYNLNLGVRTVRDNLTMLYNLGVIEIEKHKDICKPSKYIINNVEKWSLQ